MKKLKRPVIRIVSVALALMLLLPTVAANALKRNVAVTDDFNDKETLSAVDEEIWTLIGDEESIQTVELETPGRAVRFNGSGVTAETTLLMTDWYYEIKALSFDVKMPAEAGENDWFIFDFVDVDKRRDYCGDYTETYGEPMCYEAYSQRTILFYNKLLGGRKWTEFGFASDEVNGQWISVKVEVLSDTTADIYVAPQGGEFTAKQTVSLSGRHIFTNSAVVFGDYQFAGYELDNIAITTESDTLREDFEDDSNDLLLPLTIREDDDKFSFDLAEEGGSRKLAFTDSPVDDRIISVEELKDDNRYLSDGDLVLDVSYTMTFPSGCDGEIAYVFGLESNDSSPACENWAYVMGKSGGRLVYYDEDGKENIKGKHAYSATDVDIKLTLTKNGNLTVTANGADAITAAGVNQYAGFTGFTVKKAVKKVIYLDEVDIQNTYYNVLTTKSLSDDFSENRLGTAGHSDYAFNATGGTLTVSDGELVFNGLSDFSYYGPAYQYESCEVTFKMTSVYTTEDKTNSKNGTYCGRWLGMDFGKYKSTTQAYGSYFTLAVKVAHEETETKDAWSEAGMFIYKDDAVSPLRSVKFEKVAAVPAAYFRDISYDGISKQKTDISPDKAVCFKYIINPDSVELYMKRVTDADYTLYARITDIDTTGYFALCCTGYSFWTIDDFEVKNTSEIYEEAPEVELEEIVLPSLESRGIGLKDTGYETEKELNANYVSASSGNVPKLVLWIGIPAVAVVAVVVLILVLTGRRRAKKRKELLPETDGKGGTAND